MLKFFMNLMSGKWEINKYKRKNELHVPTYPSKMSFEFVNISKICSPELYENVQLLKSMCV